MSRVPRPDIKNWFKYRDIRKTVKTLKEAPIPMENRTWVDENGFHTNKTDGGEVHRSSTVKGMLENPTTDLDAQWNSGYFEGYNEAQEKYLDREDEDDIKCSEYIQEANDIGWKHGVKEGKRLALDQAKYYLFRIHGEPKDGRLLDRWIARQDKYND